LHLKEKVIKEDVKDGFSFSELANNLHTSYSQLKNDRKNENKLFTKILYQMFWLITSYPFVDKKGNLLEIKFNYFNYKEEAFYFELARHIYKDSFE